MLARVNRAPLGTLRAMFDNDRAKTVTALPLVQLGIALKLMGDAPRAERAIAEAFAKKMDRPWYLGDYGSDLRDIAWMVALTHQYGLDKPEYDARVFALARSLTSRAHAADAERKQSGLHWNWLSTQEQIAIARLGKALIQNGDSVVAGTLTVGDKSTELSPDRIWSREFDGDGSACRRTPESERRCADVRDHSTSPACPRLHRQWKIISCRSVASSIRSMENRGNRRRSRKATR